LEVKELDDLVVWVNSNVLNVFKLAPEDIDYVDDEPPGALHESALIYKWCPRRKRLVRSN
jgi:hypothetical protein